MPRYFFHVRDGISVPDEDGTHLVDWHKAQQEAIHFAGALIADNSKRIKLGEDWLMEVTDETGLILFRLDFHVASTAAISGSSS